MNATGTDLKQADLPVVLCSNGTLLPGLHATLDSLVRKLGSRERIALHLFVADLDERSRAGLAGTVADAGGVGSFEFHDADLREFEMLGGLHGELMPYLRLQLAELLPKAAKIVYLDSDVLVDTDVGDLFSLPLGDAPLGAVPGERVEWNLDHDIFRQVGLDNYDTTFNSGVLLINAAWCRADGFFAKAMEFGRANRGLLRSHDQTLLNIFFARTFYPLPKKYNIIVSPESQPITVTDGIYHFMGSPKPWDPLGFAIHANWRLWKTAVARTRFSWRGFLLKYLRFYLRRAWSLRFSYLRVIQRKISPPKWD